MALLLRAMIHPNSSASTATAGHNRNHTKPQNLRLIDLSQPGRIRVGHLMTLFSVSHSALYRRLRNGAIPIADGNDGRPFWRTETIKGALAEGLKSSQSNIEGDQGSKGQGAQCL